MKIGLFVTGHFRGAPKVRENYSQFLDGHDTSVYVASWSNKDINRYNHQIDYTGVETEALARTAFGDNLKKIWVGDFDAFMTGNPPAPDCPRRLMWNDFISAEDDPMRGAYPNPQRSMDQWYSVRQAYLLAQEEYDSFDVVIRIRGDHIFLGKPPVPFHDIQSGIHVNGYTWWDKPEDRENGTLTDSSGIYPYALSDQFAWGQPKWMRKYFEYYNHFGKLWAGKLNVWHERPRSEFEKENSFLYNTEHMMSYYIQKYSYYNHSAECDMPWHRHGHNDNPHNRFDSDFYTWG
jgi:hypothetical protein